MALTPLTRVQQATVLALVSDGLELGEHRGQVLADLASGKDRSERVESERWCLVGYGYGLV